MSAFFSAYPAVCKHDPFINLSDVSQIGSLFESSFYKYVGIADTSAGFFLPEIMETVKPRTLIIERDVHIVAAELLELDMSVGDYLYYLQNEMNKVRNNPLVMTVPFGSLSELRTMTKIWFHLLPGVPFDEERYLEFNDFKITCDHKKQERIASGLKDNHINLMRDVIPKLREFSLCSAQS